MTRLLAKVQPMKLYAELVCVSPMTAPLPSGPAPELLVMLLLAKVDLVTFSDETTDCANVKTAPPKLWPELLLVKVQPTRFKSPPTIWMPPPGCWVVLVVQ